MNVLITGGTGTVGLELLRLSLRRRSFTEGHVLIRAATAAELASRWRALVALASDGGQTPADCAWLTPVAGDITRPGLGLADSDTERLTATLTHIVHAAAAIDFNAPWADVQPINVEGTRHVLALAGRARRLEGLAHVSTLYVAGRRTGVIREHELEHDAGFVNAYEQSKFEAERLVRQAMGHLPASIYRLSLLLGRSADGYVHKCLEAHKMFELFLSGRCGRLLGAPGNTLDMLPSDYAGALLHRLFFERFEPGRTFQISAGAAAPTAGDMVESFRRYLGRPDWTVDWIGADEWASICADDDGPEHGVPASAQWMFEVIGDYMLRPKTFSRHETDLCLGGDAVMPPPLVDYLPRILERCVEDGWGRPARQRP